MQLIAANIKLPFNADEATLKLPLSARIQLPVSEIGDIRIHRRSLDARDKGDIQFIYTVEFSLSDANARRVLNLGYKDVGRMPEPPEQKLEHGNTPQSSPVIVVGLGPAGLFAAYTLALHGYNVIVVERGGNITQRQKDVDNFFTNGLLNTESNIMFGEGGAGTFSDGKLTTRIKDPRTVEVLNTFVKFGADESITFDAKPHIGTDVLSKVVHNMRLELEKMGVEVKFNSCMTDFEVEDGKVKSITINETEKVPCCSVVLAIGQAARDTYRLLQQKNIELLGKPFAVGVRIEHPQDFINRSQFGKYAGHPRLGAAEYRLTAKSGSRGVYTFCMCPGGVVVASSSGEGQVVTNGMSYHSRNGKLANSAIVVQVNPSDFGPDPLAGMLFQEKIENAAFRLGGSDYSAPAMRVGDFLTGRKPERFGMITPSYHPNVVARNIGRCLPPLIVKGIDEGIRSFARQIKDFDMYDAVLTGVESRTSSPVRIKRTETGEATRVNCLYPVGEGAGYAGGIISAAVDGMRAAQQIISVFSPMA